MTLVCLNARYDSHYIRALAPPTGKATFRGAVFTVQYNGRVKLITMKKTIVLTAVLGAQVILLTGILLWFRASDRSGSNRPESTPEEQMRPGRPADDQDGPLEVPVGEPGGTCVVSGCSGQLCTEADTGGFTTCEWRAEYGCYQRATCERQPNGKCGFTMTPELAQCLSGAGRFKGKNVEPW